MGDKAEEDIVATAKLNFVDVEGTQAERDKEAQRVPIILRYYPNAADEVEAQFRQAVAKTHEQFGQSITKSFGHRMLSTEEIDSFKFQSLAVLFQKQNDSFPLSANRAALWAVWRRRQTLPGFDGGDAPAGKMAPVIHPEPIPQNFRFGARVRLFPVARTNEIVSEAEAFEDEP